MIVRPETRIGWHRKGFKLFWRRTSRLGRPRIPENLRQLIVRMVQENPTWGEERIAAGRPRPRPSIHRHELLADGRIRAQDVLGGLHHEYWFEEIAA